MLSKVINKIKNMKLGFTLVELLVVIGIIGILTTVLAGNFSNTQKRSRDAARKANLKAIANAINMYYSDYGIYPPATGGNASENIDDLLSNGGEFKKGTNVYMKKVPTEENVANRYRYYVGGTKKSFRLWAVLENINDKDCIFGEPSDITFGHVNDCKYAVYSFNIDIGSSLF